MIDIFTIALSLYLVSTMVEKDHGRIVTKHERFNECLGVIVWYLGLIVLATT